jgi:L-ascorbate metabolism protein UlaG (beta-lactamase superfamily)
MQECPLESFGKDHERPLDSDLAMGPVHELPHVWHANQRDAEVAAAGLHLKLSVRIDLGGTKPLRKSQW